MAGEVIVEGFSFEWLSKFVVQNKDELGYVARLQNPCGASIRTRRPHRSLKGVHDQLTLCKGVKT